MTDFIKQAQEYQTQLMDQFKGSIPQVKFNKNGYEIRTQVLEIAKDSLWQDYYAKWGQFETSVKKEHDEVVTRVEMPTVPGVDQVLETAQKFYNFVNNGK